jgi:hypothetical protein
MNRKFFIQKTSTLLALASFTPLLVNSSRRQEPDPLEQKLIKEFVVAGHKDLGLVKEMLLAHPNLIFCRYDWGNGDFEEAIEGAGHLGNKETANFLISKGARVNLFVLTMLGKIELVKPVLEAYPDLLYAKGPHGFTLLHHAIAGDSKEMQAYLNAKGLTETQIMIK